VKNKKRIGEILIEQGKIRIGDIDKALIDQQDTEKPIGEILVEKGLIGYRDVLEVLKEQGWEYRNCESIMDIEDTFKDMEDLWVENLIIPLKIENNIFYIIAYNPNDSKSLARIRKQYKVNGIKIYVDTKDNIEKKLCNLFGFCFTIKDGENLTEGIEDKEVEKGVFYLSEEDITKDTKKLILDKLKGGGKIVIENDTIDGIFKMTLY